MTNLEILYEDNHIIVVVKPYGILSQKDSTNDTDMLTIIKNYIKEKYNKPGNVYLGLVHRLDRPTTGIMVFAKTSKAAARLSKQIKDHEFHKSYLAVVDGCIKEKSGRFIDYLKKDEKGNSLVVKKGEGKLAELSYTVLDYNKKENKTLIEVNLKTGRHHQIRVQFKHHGYPLCGDQRYGKQDKTMLALVAYKLEFLHPVKKEVMKFTYYPKNHPYLSMFTL